MNENSSFLEKEILENRNLWRTFTSLNEIENSQNEYFYKKAGVSNKEIVNKVIQMYDWDHSILRALRPYFLTNKLQYAIENYYIEREIYLLKMLGKFLI